ncbi:MAG: lipoyl synthase [Bdellovibrionales bacterium]|nr:lipoyl synthase [Bdellovibrionales bacterium]
MNKNLASKPPWIKSQIPSGKNYYNIKKLVKNLNLATVCESAACPNIGECWNGGTATLMLMGDTCTRGCRFCNVKTGNPKRWLDEKEPEKVAFTLSRLQLNYVVLTSVNRDDLEDEGAGHFAKTIQLLKQKKPELLIEVLTPDFSGKKNLIQKIILAQPDVFAHNIETVERLSSQVRDPRAGYRKSLRVLEFVKKEKPSIYIKSSLMLGLGETKKELLSTLKDLRSIGCDVLTLGQYLRPQKRHLPVQSFISPQEFKEWEQIAKAMGFIYCASGPLVRSSYRAGEFFMSALIQKQKGIS